jgi:hypothetical protein
MLITRDCYIIGLKSLFRASTASLSELVTTHLTPIMLILAYCFAPLISLERTSRPKSSAFQELYLYHEPIGTSYTINSLSTNRQQSSYQKTFHMEIFVQRSHSMLCNQYNNGDWQWSSCNTSTKLYRSS